MYFSASAPVLCFMEIGDRNLRYFSPEDGLLLDLQAAWGDAPPALIDELKRLIPEGSK
jgi:hypothetical protein